MSAHLSLAPMSRTTAMRWRALLSTLATVLFLMSSGEAHAQYYSFCAEFMPSYQDSNVGEDYLKGETVPLKNHVMYLNVNGSFVGPLVSNSEGCFPFNYVSAGTYTLHVYNWMEFGSGSNKTTVKIRKNDNLYYAATATWTLPAASSGVQKKTVNVTGAGMDGIFRVSSVINRVPSWMTGQNYTIFTEHNGSICVACATDDTIYLGHENGWWLNRKKAVIAHEWGHLVQGDLFGYFSSPGVLANGSNKYCESVSQTRCRCGVVQASPASPLCGGEQWDRLHCLNSREFLTGAFSEGWAHYIASTTLNNNSQSTAIFPYYKNVINSSGVGHTSPPVAHQLVPSSPYRWMENYCADSMSSKGVEMDWLGFLYRVGTKTSYQYGWADFQSVMTSNPTCGGACTESHSVTWAKMEQGANSVGWPNSKKNHFIQNGSVYGVNH